MAGELRERVAPLHVRHLVHEHERRRSSGHASHVGQQHDRIHDAPVIGKPSLWAAEQRKGAIDAE